MTDIAITIDVLYTCKTCGIVKQAVAVPARTNEGVVHWMEKIAMPLLAADHHERSFLCRAGALDVWIPATGVDRLGGAKLN